MKTNMKIEIVYLSNNNEYISSIFSCFLLILFQRVPTQSLFSLLLLLLLLKLRQLSYGHLLAHHFLTLQHQLQYYSRIPVKLQFLLRSNQHLSLPLITGQLTQQLIRHPIPFSLMPMELVVLLPFSKQQALQQLWLLLSSQQQVFQEQPSYPTKYDRQMGHCWNHEDANNEYNGLVFLVQLHQQLYQL